MCNRYRTYQKLACDLWAAAVACQLAGDGRDVGAGAPARDQHGSRPAADIRRMLGDPARRRIAVLSRRRESVFGRMAITDADDDHPASAADVAAERIVGKLVAQHPAAAMEIDHDRMWPGRCRPVETVRQRASSTLHRAVADLANWPASRPALVELGDEVSRALGTERLDRRQVHLRKHAQHQSNVRLH